MAALLRGPAAAVGITVTGYETPPDPGMTCLPRPPAAAEQPTLCDRVLHDRWPGVDLSSLERSQRTDQIGLSVNDPPPLKTLLVRPVPSGGPWDGVRLHWYRCGVGDV